MDARDDRFERWADGLPPAAGWVAERRAEGAARLRALGLPTARAEAWRYTSLRRLAGLPFRHHVDLGIDEGALAPHRIAGAVELVVVNGRVAPELSRLGAGPVEAAPAPSLGDPAIDDGVAALHEALLQPGWAARASGEAGTVHILSVMVGDGPTVASPHHVVRVAANAELRLIETRVSLGGEALANGVTEVVVGAGARVAHQVIVRGAGACLHRTRAVIERDATWHRHVVALGGSLVRDDVHARLVGPGATCRLDGLLLPARGEHVDAPTRVEHEAPSCTTRELYRAVVAGGGRAVFDGTVVVREGARGTDATQSNHNLLLADDADVSTKPRLEIYNDDVKCAHGTTVGQLDAQQLAYLRMRGVPRDAARALLTHAFVADLRDAAPLPSLREAVEARLAALLGEEA